MKKLFYGLIISSFVITTSFFLPAKAFASGTLYLTPATKTVNVGESFSVAVRLSTTDQIDTVHAVMSYPADKLDFVSIDGSASPFGWKIEETGGNGSVTITRGTLGTPPVSGDQLVASVTFRGKAAGSASVAFTADSGAATNGVNVLTGRTGGTYNVSSPSPVPTVSISASPASITSGQTSTLSWSSANATSVSINQGIGTVGPSGSKQVKPTASITYTAIASGPGGNSSPAYASITVNGVAAPPAITPPATPATPGVDTTAPKISNIKVAATTTQGATITWTTDEKASSIVEYGLSTKYDLSAVGVGDTTNHEVSFTSKLLLPGLTIHFRVKSIDTVGNLATSQDFTFKTKGYSIQIKVVDPTGIPVSGVKVILYPGLEEGTTDWQGLVKFEDISLGKHVVELTLGDATASDSINVKDSKDTQDYQLTAFAGKTTLGGILQISLLGGVLGLFVALIAVLVLWWRRHKKLRTLVSDVTDSEKPNSPNLPNLGNK